MAEVHLKLKLQYDNVKQNIGVRMECGMSDLSLPEIIFIVHGIIFT